MINTYIVEDHNDALEYLYKEIGSKRLSYSNLTMIHFDSHPDLGLSSTLLADDVFKKNILFDNLSIENWILPAVYAKHINKIVWIKPNWSNQIPSDKYNLIIGKHTKTGLIKLNSTLSYFISDNLYSNKADLLNKHEFQLLVCDFDQISTNKDLIEFLGNDSNDLILDVDLDFFSTRDPFKSMFNKRDDYDLFKSVYQHKIPQNDSLNFDTIYQSFINDKQIKNNEILAYLKSESSTTNDLNLIRLKETILQNKIDLEILHSYGCGIDECELPDHVSTQTEIDSMILSFGEFLNTFNLKPKCITVARSSLDDYCPPEQVNTIQTNFINLIQSHYTRLNIKKCFDE